MLRWFTLVLLLLLAPLAWASGIDLNSASLSELDTLPGIGPAKATAIIEYREANGPFARPEDVVNVPGIGPATWANIQAMVTAGAAAPPDGAPGDAAPADEAPADARPAAGGPPTNAVNINTADAAALGTLPGIGPTKAEAIVADREANGPFASCQDLARVAGIGPATVSNVSERCAVK